MARRRAEAREEPKQLGRTELEPIVAPCFGRGFRPLYEYSTAGFIWSSHAYGTAFFSLTGLHGLHVLVGLIMIGAVLFLMAKGHYDRPRHDSFRAIIMYWHFVDAVWVLLFFIVYLEVI